MLTITFPGAVHIQILWGVIAKSHIVASRIPKLLLSFRQILQFRFRENPQGWIPMEADQNEAISVHVLLGSFRRQSFPLL